MTRFEPVLSGADADRALGVAADIVAAVRQSDPADAGPYLGGGSSGLAVLCAWWAAGPGDEADAAAADAFLDHALEGVADAEWLNGDFYANVPGVGWALDQVDRAAGRFDGEGDEERDDDVLVEKILSATPWPGVHDLTRGLTGLAIHALEGLPRTSAARRLATVVDRLSESATEIDDEATWWTTPESVLPDRAAMYPNGYIDVGVAHGIAGVIPALAAAGARSLALSAVRYLWSLQLSDADTDLHGRFPGMVEPGERRAMSRVAWCYGDAGIAWAFIETGIALEDDQILGWGLTTARSAARRPFGRSGCIDAGLCHGAAGIAHCLHRVAMATGDDEIFDAARRWVGHTLDYQRADGRGIAGYLAVVPDWAAASDPSNPPMVERGVTGLLEGASGVALSLLSAATGAWPHWDRFLMPQVPQAQ